MREVLSKYKPFVCKYGKGIQIGFLVFALFLSLLYANVASSEKTHMEELQTLDSKQSTIAALSVSSASASALITLIPGDACTPIADELAKITTFFTIVTCAILIEKAMLTITGMLCFKCIVPIGLILWIFGLYFRKRAHLSNIGKRLIILGLVLYAIVPISLELSSLIEEGFQSNVNECITIVNEIENKASEEDASNWWDDVSSFFSSIGKSVTGGYEWAKTILSQFINACAVFLVTTCAIPLLVIFCFKAALKILFNVNIPVSIYSLTSTVKDAKAFQAGKRE